MSSSTASRPRVILHVDMDAFYVSVETLREPSLRGKPVIVGGDGARGVVASCSYEARAFGVRSAMPSVRAKRLCPHAVFLRGNHKLYDEYSAKIHEVFHQFTPVIEPIALDEAFLDMSNATRLFGDGRTVAVAIRSAVFDATGLWCSVGVAPNKLLAKLASKDAKPPIGVSDSKRVVPGAIRVSEGILEVEPGSELAFLHPQPARALWGIGPKTFERLQRFGVNTIGDLAEIPVHALVGALGTATAHHLHALASGQDSRPVEADRGVKSIGHEETFAVDYFETGPLEAELLRLADAVSTRLRKADLRGRTVNLKLKTSDFRSITRARTMHQPIDTVRVLHRTAIELLHADDVRELIETVGVRLIGVSMSNLIENTNKPSGRNLSADPNARIGSIADEYTDTGTEASTGASTDPKRVRVEPSLASHAVEEFATKESQLSLFDDSSSSATGREPEARPVRESKTDLVVAETIDAIRARFGTKSVGAATFARRPEPEKDASNRRRDRDTSGRTRGLRVKEEGDTQWGPQHESPGER